MSICTYDNPATWRRECWQDGRLLCFYSANLYFLKVWPIPARLYFFGANIGPWEDGQMVGDPAAMKKIAEDPIAYPRIAWDT